MPYRQRRLQLAEICRQADFALRAYHDAVMALRENDEEKLWYSLHALLAAASHLNAILWPGTGRDSGNSAALRSALGVDQDSPLAQPAIRESSDPAALVEAWTSGSYDPERARVFDANTSILLFYGVALETQPLLTSVAELRNRAAAEMQHMREIV